MVGGEVSGAGIWRSYAPLPPAPASSGVMGSQVVFQFSSTWLPKILSLEANIKVWCIQEEQGIPHSGV